jgi:hypothetical protein
MINDKITPNPLLHVWLDAPGIYDELAHITDPEVGSPSDLRLAAEYLMSKTAEEIEMVGWQVMEDDEVWDALNASIRESVIRIAKSLREAEEVVPSVNEKHEARNT